MSNPKIAEAGIATQFKPGCAPGPGRPKRRPITERYAVLAETPIEEDERKELKLPEGSTYADAAVHAVYRRAMKGDTSAIREIREALEGKSEKPIADERSISELITEADATLTRPTGLGLKEEEEETVVDADANTCNRKRDGEP
jgi:hypothetical protein